jgi:Dna[CI] antecedent, DciA
MRKRRPKLVHPEALDGVLMRAGENRFARKKPPLPERLWIEAVGHRIAERAHPLGLEHGVLTVRAATSVWANELSLLSDELIARLRERGVAVNELRFRVGPLERHAPAAEPCETREVPPPASLPGAMVEALQSVGDDELKQAIEGAARANLAWRRGGSGS